MDSLQRELAEAKSRGFDHERQIFGPSDTLSTISGPQSEVNEGSYTNGWKFPRKEHNDMGAGKTFRKLFVADPDGTRKPGLIRSTAIQVDTVIYKNAVKDPQLILSVVIPVYEFKVYGTGER